MNESTVKVLLKINDKTYLRKNSQAAILWARNSISVLSQLNRKPLSANRTLNKSEHPTYTKAGCVHPAFDGSTESKKGLYEENLSICHRVPDEHGCAHHTAGADGGTEQQPVYMQATSAETNVLNVASSLGRECLALTKFVKGSPVADFIKRQLRARNIRFEGIEVEQGGPWGYRHQFNVADSGFGMRAPRLWNDRTGEVGRTLSIEDFDVERIFGQEGVGILHLSGLIAAMSHETTECCLALAKAAKQYGTLVSFDLNYRATFWKGREEELPKAFSEIASLADVLIGNEEDFQLCLGFKGPEAGGKICPPRLNRSRA